MVSSSGLIQAYCMSDLKTITDQALPNYLNSISFVQTHKLEDVRLAFGYSMALIAGVTFFADWKSNWTTMGTPVAIAVAVYVAINAFLTYWAFYVEKSIIYKGSRDQTELTIESVMVDRFKPLYTLKVRAKRSHRLSNTISSSPKSDVKKSESNYSTTYFSDTISAPFGLWFTVEGKFLPKPFQEWLASTIPLVGMADPQTLKNASENAVLSGAKK